MEPPPVNPFFQFLDKLDQLLPGRYWLCVEKSGIIRAASAQLEKRLLYSGKEPLAGRSVTAINPRLSLFAWEKDWRQLKGSAMLETQTELLRRDKLLLPFFARITYLDQLKQPLAFILLEDRLQLEGSATAAADQPSTEIRGSWTWDFSRREFRYYGSLPPPEHDRAPQEVLSLRTAIRIGRRILGREGWKQLRREIRRCLSDSLSYEIRLPAAALSGEDAILYLSGRILRSSLRQNLRMSGTWRMVRPDEQPGDQQALRAFSLDHAQDMIFWVRPDGSFAYVNQTVCDRLGYRKEELLRKNAVDIAPDFDERAREELWSELREKKYLEHRIQLKTREGDLFPIYSTLYYQRIDGREYSCTFSRDWSGKKVREDRLHLGEETLENLTELVFWTDSSGQICFINQAARELTGLEKEEALNLSFESICPDWGAPAKDFGQQERETHLLGPEGSIPVELSKTRLDIDGETIWCYIGRDIRQRRARIAELEAARRTVEELSQRLREENVLLREEIASHYNFNNILTRSDAYRRVLALAQEVAKTSATVLITGETGTGKELLARAIHSLSDRREATLVKVNCAALPENLIESELFGHVKGAFTSAIRDKKGRFELADGGTIFLDEIGELQLDLQTKLLRVLQEGEFERVGSTETKQVDVRVIAATNRNLEERVEQGKFRQDLYYRLNVFPIRNLPLRERQEDIPLLVQHFMKKFADRMGKTIEKVSKRDLNLLQNYSFPGNVRELENMVERAVILTQGTKLNLRSSFRQGHSQPGQGTPEEEFLSFEEMQKRHIIKALEQTGWRVSGPHGAGQLLGLNDRTLASKMRKMGIQRKKAGSATEE